MKAITPSRHCCAFALLRTASFAGAIMLLPTGATSQAANPAGLGAFEQHADFGQVTKPGNASFDPAANTYSVTAGGENMWGTKDAGHLAWRRMSGDFVVSTDLRWLGQGTDPHRKAGLMVRAGLAADAAYVDAVVHGDGLTSLQFREATGQRTHEVQSPVRAPQRLRLERRGEVFLFSTATTDGDWESTGCSLRLKFADPVGVGLVVCAHNTQVVETAVFSGVRLEEPAAVPATNLVIESRLETISIASEDRKMVHHDRRLFEAPNWSRDGKTLFFNQGGAMFQIPATGGTPQKIDTGAANRCNNDHGLSPDGAQLAISSQHADGKSRIYILPISGGEPRLITPLAPSYWHGWSPDGKTLAYCAERGGEFDVYTIPVSGGEERRLTTATGLDDGPDYTADGQWIYFNSDRTGTMKIWRMKPDGSAQEQVTTDELNDWFPHPSPDGKWLLFLSYAPGVKDHPANQPVTLRLMPLAGGAPRTLIRLFGGQGTLNVPCWAPDSRSFAFVSYELVTPTP